MVTPLDIGLLQVFQVIFPFLFILTMIFAFLTKIQPFKENYVYAALIAVSLAVLTMFSPIAIETINVAAPYFVLVFVGIVFALMGYYILGYSEQALTKSIMEGEYADTLAWWIFALTLIIGIGSFTAVVSEERGFSGLTTENATAIVKSGPPEQTGFFQVLLHPKVLGMAVVLLVAFFAVSQLARKSTK